MSEQPNPNADDSIEEAIQLINDQLREARACNLAILRILKEIAPLASPEIREVIGKFKPYYREKMQKLLLNLESINPERAASLDKDRPLFLSDEEDP